MPQPPAAASDNAGSLLQAWGREVRGYIGVGEEEDILHLFRPLDGGTYYSWNNLGLEEA